MRTVKVGLEPTTKALTVLCSAIELLYTLLTVTSPRERWDALIELQLTTQRITPL